MEGSAALRPASAADFPEMHRVRMSVRENRLSNAARYDDGLDVLGGRSSGMADYGPGARAERFNRSAGWRHAGVEPGGEARYVMTREQWLAAASPSVI